MSLDDSLLQSGAHMHDTYDMTSAPAPTFTATVIASDAFEAMQKVNRRVREVGGFCTTGQAMVRDAKHRLWDVQVLNEGGNVNDCWVWLTSFGITPSEDLGSRWQTVPGVGAFG